MGSNTSKPNNSTSIQPMNNSSDGNSNSDPRSPTPEVTRTPLQTKSGAKHNITKNVDLRKTFECAQDGEKLIHNNPILSAVIKNHLQSYDPRSPTQEFERTPIVIVTKSERSKDKEMTILCNDNNCASPQLNKDIDEMCDSCSKENEISPDLILPRNLCNGFFDMTLNDSLNEAEEPLGSSTASNEAIEDNMSHSCSPCIPTQLLETNFDYVEPETEKNTNAEVVSGKSSEEVLNIPLFKILNVDPRSPSVGIERTPIVVPKTNDDSSEDVEDMSDDTLIQVLQNTSPEIRQVSTNTSEKNQDGLLIYEDETNVNDTRKKLKSASNNGSRTPLSCMKNKTEVPNSKSKSSNTLYDPAVSKIPKRSYIPRLKPLKQTTLLPTESSISLKNVSKTAVSGNCENTPPHSHRDRWDKDNSIVL